MISGLTVHDAILAIADRSPAKPAIYFDDQVITYGELGSRSAVLARVLSERCALTLGDRAAILLPNSPEFLIAILAIARSGAIVVPVPYQASRNELAHYLQDSESALLITDRDVDVTIPLVRPEESLNPSGHVDDLPRIEVDEQAPFFIGYTSGTSGKPKGAIVSHRSRLLTMLQYGHEYGCYNAEDRAIVLTPLYHGGGLTRSLAPLVLGSAIDVLPKYRPEHAVARLHDPAVTSMYVVPTIVDSLLSLPEETLAAVAHRSFTVMSNAAPLSDEQKQRIVAIWPRCRLFEIYGSTEAGTVSALRPESILAKAQSAGQPLPFVKVKILDDAGSPLPHGETGELFVSSPYVFSGYRNRPDSAPPADGFVSVGDLASLDEDGFLYIRGRKTDMILSGGVNIYPREIEEVLLAHPDVAEVAVIGRADSHWGERVHAVVVASTGAAVDFAALEQHCRMSLSPVKTPRSWEQRDHMPRTASGKILKRALVPEGEGKQR